MKGAFHRNGRPATQQAKTGLAGAPVMQRNEMGAQGCAI